MPPMRRWAACAVIAIGLLVTGAGAVNACPAPPAVGNPYWGTH